MHIPILSTFDNVIIDSVAESDFKRGKELALKLEIPHFFEDYSEMYQNDELDAVFICLPNFLHYDSVKNALKNDLHVFCEKPMGLNPKEAEELVNLAEKKDLILAVGYNRRLAKNYQETRKIVESLKLGKILQINGVLVNAGPYGGWMPSSDWFFKDKYGVLYDSGPHLIDIMMYVLSDDIVEVAAKGISTLNRVNIYDNIVGHFKTGNNIMGTFNIGWRLGVNYDSLQIHGTAGSVFTNPLEVEYRHGGYGPLEKISNNFKLTKSLLGTFIGQSGRGDIPDETFFQEDQAFIDAVLDKSAPLVSGADGLKILKVLEGIRKSLDSGEIVEI